MAAGLLEPRGDAAAVAVDGCGHHRPFAKLQGQRHVDNGNEDLRQFGRAPAQLIPEQATVASASACKISTRARIIAVGSMPSRIAT